MKISIENIKWLTIIGLILYIVFLQQCSGPSVNNGTVVSSSTDTIRISHTDTIRFTDTIPRYVSIYIPKPVPITEPTTPEDTINLYTTIVKDSLIDGTISSKVKGELLEQSFKYIPLFPKYIIKSDSIIVNNTQVIEQKAKTYLLLGGEVGGNLQAFNVSPVVTLATKKGYNYSYRYGILDKTHNIGITVKLSFKKK